MDAENLSGIYKEIAYATDFNTAIKIHELFKGQQIVFPQKLYDKEFVYSYIRDNYNGHNVRELSKMFGYSDRRVRQILNKISV